MKAVVLILCPALLAGGDYDPVAARLGRARAAHQAAVPRRDD